MEKRRQSRSRTGKRPQRQSIHRHPGLFTVDHTRFLADGMARELQSDSDDYQRNREREKQMRTVLAGFEHDQGVRQTQSEELSRIINSTLHSEGVLCVCGRNHW